MLFWRQKLPDSFPPLSGQSPASQHPGACQSGDFMHDPLIFRPVHHGGFPLQQVAQ